MTKWGDLLKRRMGPQGFLLCITAIALVGSLLDPDVRELHILTFRLLFHLQGDTWVQGQPGGCDVYPVPNVQISAKLERKSLRVIWMPIC
jgi:hypothetical protein